MVSARDLLTKLQYWSSDILRPTRPTVTVVTLAVKQLIVIDASMCRSMLVKQDIVSKLCLEYTLACLPLQKFA